MHNTFKSLWNDQAGFVISAELVLISTIVVLGLIVGLSEVSLNVNNELEDVGSATGSIHQDFRYAGLEGHQGATSGSTFVDSGDFCDSQDDIQSQGANNENVLR